MLCYDNPKPKGTKTAFSGGSGCGSVGRVVASDSRDLRFETSHLKNTYFR